MEGAHLVVNAGKRSFKCKPPLSAGNLSHVVIAKREYTLGKPNASVVSFYWLGDNMWDLPMQDRSRIFTVLSDTIVSHHLSM